GLPDRGHVPDSSRGKAAPRRRRQRRQRAGQGLCHPGAWPVLRAQSEDAGLKPAERARIRSEAEKMLQAVQKQYATVEIPFYGKAGDKARRELFELQHLTVGLQVPDIQGVDLDGKAFKLSDYRGKVVFLDFWAHW